MSVPSVINKEELLVKHLYGYGKPTQPTPADGSANFARLPDVADRGIPYGVPRSLLSDFREVSRTASQFVEDARAHVSSLNKWLQENNFTFEQYNSHNWLPGTKKSVFDLYFAIHEMSALAEKASGSYFTFEEEKDSYNEKYDNLIKTKNTGEIIKPGSIEREEGQYQAKRKESIDRVFQEKTGRNNPAVVKNIAAFMGKYGGRKRKTHKGKKSRKTLKKTQSRKHRKRGGSSCSGM